MRLEAVDMMCSKEVMAIAFKLRRSFILILNVHGKQMVCPNLQRMTLSTARVSWQSKIQRSIALASEWSGRARHASLYIFRAVILTGPKASLREEMSSVGPG